MIHCKNALVAMNQSKKLGTVIFHFNGVHTGNENLGHKSLHKKLSAGDRVVRLRNCGAEANFKRVSSWLFKQLQLQTPVKLIFKCS